MILTQPSADKISFENDIRGLCKIIAFIFKHETMDCNADDLCDEMDEQNNLEMKDDNFIGWFFLNGSNFNHRTLLKLSLLKQIGTSNYNSANSILHHPIFWNDKEKFEKIKQIAGQWKNKSSASIEIINKMGEFFLKRSHSIKKVECKCVNKIEIPENKMTNLVNIVATKVK